MGTKDKSQSGITVYHGTDEAILKLKNSERKLIKEACKTVFDFYYPVFEQLQDSFLYRTGVFSKIDRYEYSRFMGLFIHPNNELFEYKDFYVTNSERRAESYARNSLDFGEIGHFVNLMLSCADKYKIDLPQKPQEVLSAIQVINEFKAKEHHPVVIEFKNIGSERLLSEAGDKLSIGDMMFLQMGSEVSFRLKGDPFNGSLMYTIKRL